MTEVPEQEISLQQNEPKPESSTATTRVFVPPNISAPPELSLASVAEPSKLQQYVAGTVSEKIGTGPNAKDSVVYLTIQWSFAVASVATVMVLLHDFWISDSKEVANLKDIWTVFIPIITLGLGYMFGKEKS